MLNDISKIKGLWPGDVVNIDDTEKDENELTAYDRFISILDRDVKRRLCRWISREAYDDASLETPLNEDRADAMSDAEIHLFHAAFMEQVWRDKCAGSERDIQLPSGMRITLQAFSGDECQNIIAGHLNNAELAVMEYML